MLTIVFDSGRTRFWLINDNLPIQKAEIGAINHIYADRKEAEYIIGLFTPQPSTYHWYDCNPTIPVPNAIPPEDTDNRVKPIYWWGDIAKTIIANL